MKRYFSVPDKIASSDGGLECLPASLVMAVGAFGRKLSLDDAKDASGYEDGKETWPYRMLAWLAENGFQVRHIDAVDARSFAKDPVGELHASGFDDETIKYFISISDFDAETKAINRAIQLGVIFDTRLPSSDDLAEFISSGWLPILTLDAGVLVNERLDGYQGHMVLVTGRDDQTADLEIQDTGPPAHWDWQVPETRVFQALRTPSESSGTITLVRLD